MWLGTRDGLLHAFDARSGEEVLAYLPHALLQQAAAWASRAEGPAPSASAPVAPCPYPEAADVALERGRWRTVLLCGLPASDAGRADQDAHAGMFALDITDVGDRASQFPLALLWEAMASDSLPLAPAGPVRALALTTPEGPRWYAMAALAPEPGGKTRSGEPHHNPSAQQAGLALLPLDKPARAPWHGRHAIPRLHLPGNGCGIGGASPALLAASILPDASGTALAAYVVDAIGRLWRFDLRGAALWRKSEQRVRCIHRLETPVPWPAQSSNGTATFAAPVLIDAQGGHLVVYGSGNHIAAVFDSASLADSGGRHSKSTRIATHPQGNGVVLRRQSSEPEIPDQPTATGWHPPLPHPGERLDRLMPADPGYLGVVTRTPDARQRIYLIHALSGDSAVSEQAGGPRIHASTGLAAEPQASIVLGRAPLPPAHPTQPGITSREAVALTLWSLEHGRAVPHNRTVASRRTGRLRWRKLIRSGSP